MATGSPKWAIMLHELLLALSGHASPLLSQKRKAEVVSQALSPSELALLSSIARFGTLHIQLLETTSNIAESHPSFVCQGVAKTVASVHLAEFRKNVLNVEREILQNDSSLVGAYNIVPLSSIVGLLTPWGSKLEFLDTLVRYMVSPTTGSDSKTKCGHASTILNGGSASGSQTIDWLRQKVQTGFPDIEKIALNLATVAESIWLRQLTAYVLYGRLPALGAEDFLIHQAYTSHGADMQAHRLIKDLAPSFISLDTANSVLFIGKSLNYVRELSKTLDPGICASSDDGTSLAPCHMRQLSSLKLPINSLSISRAIGAIRASLSQNTLQKLLPITNVTKILHIFLDFFLLKRGDFAIALITAADACLIARQTRLLVEATHKDAQRFGGMMMNEGEVAGVLARVWIMLAALQSDEESDGDEGLEFARGYFQLSIKKQSSLPVTSTFALPDGPFLAVKDTRSIFDDILLATPTSLHFTVPSPLDLFLTNAEVDAYSSVNSYLLAIRRAHIHLTELWKLNGLRRTPRTVCRPQVSLDELNRFKTQINRFDRRLRSTWAMIGSTSFFLAELGEYFQGEVVKCSSAEFFEWLRPSNTAVRPDSHISGDHADPSSSSNEGATRTLHSATTPRDPETLTIAHRAYISSLAHSLLLDDILYTKMLKALMTRIDHVKALVVRLCAVQEMTISGDSDSLGRYGREENELMTSLSEVRISISSDVKDLVKRLHDIDLERPSGRLQPTIPRLAEVGFTPWNGGGLYRLLMKLDIASLGRTDSG
ncbi:hypothetical protein MMC19_007575 [Ptychographa xylographoides]|nr:hypothetical protein [Ptychographa xylographoides]